MRVRVLLFGMLRDVAGRSEEELELGAGARLENVFEHYAALLPSLRAMASSVVLARNQDFARPDTPLADGDEVALLPPVSGGCGPWTHQIETPEGHFFALTREPVDSRALAAKLLQAHDGAEVIFEGVVRNNTNGRPTLFLDYECYEAMAVKMMASIGTGIANSLAISRIGIVHRLGRMEIGETSVAIVVTAPHRKPAFEAALEGINRLKKLVPIWKKEHFAGGEVWVEGDWDESVVQR